MTTYIPFFSLTDLGLTASTAELLQRWLSQMQTAFPGYEPSQGNLEYFQAQIFSTFAADLAQLCASGSAALFENFGTQLLSLPVHVGSPAIAVAEFTTSDSLGHTVIAGTQLLLTAADNSTVGFATAVDLVIPAGQTTGQVTIAAAQPGTLFNGAGDPANLNIGIDWVSGVTIVSNAADGEEPEDQQHYLNRLRQTTQLLAPRPITASDYATMALDFTPEANTDQQQVGRATSIDGYDPDANTYDNERQVCVCITDSDGDPLDSDTLAAVKAWFQAQREQNFIVNVVSPNYSTVYVSATVVATQGWTTTMVQSAVQSALLSYLSPANFGLTQGAPLGWQNSTSIFFSRIEAVVQNVPAVDHIVTGTLAMGLTSNPSNTSNDLVLPGPFPLPQSSTSSVPLAAITVI